MEEGMARFGQSPDVPDEGLGRFKDNPHVMGMSAPEKGGGMWDKLGA